MTDRAEQCSLARLETEQNQRWTPCRSQEITVHKRILDSMRSHWKRQSNTLTEECAPSMCRRGAGSWGAQPSQGPGGIGSRPAPAFGPDGVDASFPARKHTRIRMLTRELLFEDDLNSPTWHCASKTCFAAGDWRRAGDPPAQSSNATKT